MPSSTPWRFSRWSAETPAETGQLKLWPQPQVRFALGLVILKPDSFNPSV